MTRIRITGINIYPIKSCKGISPNEAWLSKTGLMYDRQFVLVDERGNFLSQRCAPKMSCIETAIGESFLWVAANGGHCSVPLHGTEGERHTVEIWGGKGAGIDMGDDAARWLSEVLGIQCRLLRQDATQMRKRHSSVLQQDVELSFADGYHVLIISEESLADLNGRLGDNPVKMNCFRPNIVVSGCDPFAEDQWTDIQAGQTRLTGVKLCERCSIPMVNQSTGEFNPRTQIAATGRMGIEPSATLATYRRLPPAPGKDPKVCFGKNFNVLLPGIVRVGDLVIPV